MKPKLMTVPEVAEYCRQLREKSKLTQAELAAALGTSRQMITFAENPTLDPYHKVRREIIEHFGGSIEEIYRVQ